MNRYRQLTSGERYALSALRKHEALIAARSASSPPGVVISQVRSIGPALTILRRLTSPRPP